MYTNFYDISYNFKLSHILELRTWCAGAQRINVNPTCESESSSTDLYYVQFVSHSGFPSSRINLSPFTKDFRGGEQLNESVDQFFCRLALRRGHPKKRNKCKQSLGEFIRVVNESKTNFSSPCLSAGSLREVKQV